MTGSSRIGVWVALWLLLQPCLALADGQWEPLAGVVNDFNAVGLASAADGYVYCVNNAGRFQRYSATANEWTDLAGVVDDFDAVGLASAADGYIYCVNNSGLFQRYRYSPIPEPSSIIALLVGIGGLGGLTWRRKSAA